MRNEYSAMVGLTEKGSTLPPELNRDFILQSVGPNLYPRPMCHAGSV
ncbi:MAG: hypothetical protein ACFCUX_03795 [Candidatus Methylacidiphilales bacterium]